jgi:ABC-2 type transport system ATP-binding protein
MSMQAQSIRRARCCHDGSVTAIEVEGLKKAYGEHEAVRGIDFQVRRGEVFGLLGPNGAGKTTTVEILEGYRSRSAGRVSVLGHDPASRDLDLRARMGIVLQSSGIYQYLTVRESVAHWAGLYPRPRDVEEVISIVGLEGAAEQRAGKLSGGQQRRLDLALALIGDPELIFLDEPTTGFDPGARRRAWDTIRSLSGLGKTILLTTHYLDEVEQLADRVAVLREGRIVASGTVQELVGGAPATEIRYRRNGEVVVVETDEPTRVLHELTEAAIQRGEELDGLEVRKPSLEEVYLSLTQAEPE